MHNNMVLLKEADTSIVGITGIIVDADSQDIEFYSSGEPNLKIRQYSSKNTLEEELFVVSRENSVIRISARHMLRVFSINFGFSDKLLIEIPQNWLGDIDVGLFSGNIRLSDAFMWNNVNLSSSSGDLLLRNELTAKNLNLNASSGNIQARDGHIIANKISATTSSGDIRLQAPLTAQSISIKATSGNISLDQASVEQFAFRNSSGDIKVKSLSGGGSATVTSGNINISLSDLVGDVDLQASSGNVRLSLSPELSCNFTGRCTSGDIHANFPLTKNEKGNRATATIGETPVLTINAETTSGNIRVDRL